MLWKRKTQHKSEKYFSFGGFECLGVILIRISNILVYSTGMIFLGVGPPPNFG